MKKLLILLVLIALTHYLVKTMGWKGELPDLVHTVADACKWVFHSAARLMG